VLAFADSLDDGVSIEFADEDGSAVRRPQAKWFTDFLRRLPLPVMVGEFCEPETSFGDGDEMALPDGYSLDPGGSELHRRATEYMWMHGGAYADAVREVEARHRVK
jgi:hypothetical protein